jgi:hypothetical protein
MTAGSMRPAGPMFRGHRPLKQWRYVGVFCDELMLCAAQVRVGPARQSFWAVLTREDGALRERTRTVMHRGVVELAPGRLRIREAAVMVDVTLEEDAGWEARCPHGAQQVWTRKQAGIAARGTVSLNGAVPRPIEARAVVDDTAGYHARVTEWRWAAGVGVDAQGRTLAFNLVEGVNDPPTGSERAVWVEGVPHDAGTAPLVPHDPGPTRLIPHEAGPVHFAPDLTRITAEDGSLLRFRTEAERRRSENLLLVRSDYRAPFGTFSGTLPGGIELAHGLGVMEHHRARW